MPIDHGHRCPRTKMERSGSAWTIYLGVMTVGSHNKPFRPGLAALLLTALLGASMLAQADETAPEGKIEARSELFAKDHADQFTSWKGTSESRERTDALADDPQMVVLWAGYPFSKDYNKPRGHFYALTDVRETLRTGAPKTAEDGPLPMACWTGPTHDHSLR